MGSSSLSLDFRNSLYETYRLSDHHVLFFFNCIFISLCSSLLSVAFLSGSGSSKPVHVGGGISRERDMEGDQFEIEMPKG